MSEGYKSITGLTDIPATPAVSAGIQTCMTCGNPFSTLNGQGSAIGDKWVCNACRPATQQKMAGAAVASQESGDFVISLLFGVAAAIVGLGVYAGFTIVTHFYFGYVALLVGWIIAKAMMVGSKGVGGPKYQAAAVVLTYLAISLAAVPIVMVNYAQNADGSQVDWASHVGDLAFYGLFSPFLRLQAGISHIIGLVILFVGIRIAWRIAAGTKQ